MGKTEERNETLRGYTSILEAHAPITTKANSMARQV